MSQQQEYIECERRLRGFFRARVRNLADADELAQETWLTVLKQRDSYDSERGPFMAFVFSRAHYVLLNYFQCMKDQRAMESLFCELQTRDDPEGPSYDPAEASGRGALLRYDGHEEIAWQTRLDYFRIVDRLLTLPSPPHQIIVFVMIWLLESTPREIAESRSAEPLRRLESQVESECGVRWCLSEGEIQKKFRVLRERLAEMLAKILTEPRTRLTYQALLDRVAGDTALQDYYIGVPRDNIVQWWYSVMRVLEKIVHRDLRSEARGE